MTAHDESSNRPQSSPEADARAGSGSKTRLLVLIGLLALALFALWYDYKVARPAVEQAYERISAMNERIITGGEHRLMTNADVQSELGRSPNETFLSGNFTVEAYRWSAGMPIAFRGLSGDESPGIGMKTHDYYAVYRKDGPTLAFVTHFKFDLDAEDLAVPPPVTAAAPDALGEQAAPGMVGYGGAGPGVGGGRGGRGGPGGREPGGEGEGRRQRPPLESSSETPSSETPSTQPASTDAAPAAEPTAAPAETAAKG